MSYRALLIAPDGEWVTDYRDCETIAEVTDKLADRGSRWIFYPYEFVIVDHGITRETHRIVDACEPFLSLIGKTIKTASAAVIEHAQNETDDAPIFRAEPFLVFAGKRDDEADCDPADCTGR